MKYTKIPLNETQTGMARLERDQLYSTATGEDLFLDVLHPWNTEKGFKYPLIVFVQGSAWTTPDRNYELPQLSCLAKRGYVVATINHRDTQKGHPVPAFLEDTKCAIRFLRANAEKYGIDPERVAIFGTSSGGNTSLLVGLTGDDPEYKTAEYAEYSDAVKTAVECFGPADLLKLLFRPHPELPKEQVEMYRLGFYGTRDEEKAKEIAKKLSPTLIVDEKKEYPPFLVIQGSGDPVVPFAQSKDFADRMEAAGKYVEFIEVEGAEHEGNFWSRELWELIFDYIDRTL